MPATTRYRFKVEAPANGRIRKATVTILDAEGRVCHTDKADLVDARERKGLVKRAAEALDADAEELAADLERCWNEAQAQYQRHKEQAAAGSPEAVPEIRTELVDSQPDVIRRPLCLVGGQSYAAAWCQVRVETTRTVDQATGAVTEHNPPVVRFQDCLVIIRDDGQAFADDVCLPGVRPIAELGLPVRLPNPVQPGRGWSGAGVKRYLAGERPDPAEVFRRLVSVVDSFLDFSRSLADQSVMCELVAAHIMATYMLDAFHVVGYLWPNGDPGSGKTTALQVVSETAFLGQMILAGSSYPTLRDLADYGATLAFDDAEAVMDTKRTDPDKRTLLLAGNRKGATIAVKELENDRWVTRHVSTFCPRLFSAIRLPDQVLGSRCIILPLVRSGDAERTKSSPMDPECWPCDRQRLVDDLWALGLASLPQLPALDREAARAAELSGRALEPWRMIFAVTNWLASSHRVTGLFRRMLDLSQAYQKERGDYEETDSIRVLFRALLDLTEDRCFDEAVEIKPAAIASRMCEIAHEEDLAEPEKPFITARKVGWLMKRQRFKRGQRDSRSKTWRLVRGQVESAAKAHGVEIPGPAEAVTDDPNLDGF